MLGKTALPSSLSRLRERVGVRARELRHSSTDAEKLVWRHLRNRNIAGFKFRRQHAVGSYIADFACVEAGLIVEIDGGQHLEFAALAADAHRTAVLQRAGFAVLRFDNRQVLTETKMVLASIHDFLERCGPQPSPESRPHPSPLPQAGEGANQED